MVNIAIKIIFSASIVVLLVFSAHAEKISIGRINSEMSVAEMQALLGQGKKSCLIDDDSVPWSCVYIFESDSDRIEVQESKSEKILLISRRVGIPEGLEINDIFDQLEEKYRFIGNVQKNTASRTLSINCDDVGGVCDISAKIISMPYKKEFGEWRILKVTYVNKSVLNEWISSRRSKKISL